MNNELNAKVANACMDVIQAYVGNNFHSILEEACKKCNIDKNSIKPVDAGHISMMLLDAFGNGLPE